MKIFKNITVMISLIMLLSNTVLYAAQPYNESEEPIPEIVAEAYVVMDGESGNIIYGHNENSLNYPASTTKILTAYLASQILDPEDTILYTESMVNSISYNTSRIGIRVNEEISVNDTFHGMLLMSGNETANALAETSAGSIDEFVDLMNETALIMGATNTHFTNPHGLYDVNHYTTAYDLALITKEVITDEYVLEVMNHSTYEIQPTNESDEIRYLYQQHKMLNNKNDMRIYREDVIAGKVGYTSESGHTLVTVAKQDQRTIIVVVLKTNASNVYKDTEKLLNYGFAVPVSDILTPEPPIEVTETLATESLLEDSKSQSANSVTVKLQVEDPIPVVEPVSDSNGISIGIILLLLLVLLVVAAKAHSYIFRKRLKEKYKQI